ncbi:hypothetical protein Bca4012_065150 [Brassica carinata]
MELMDTPPKSVMNFMLTCFPESKEEELSQHDDSSTRDYHDNNPPKRDWEAKSSDIAERPVSLSRKNKHDNWRTPIL